MRKAINVIFLLSLIVVSVASGAPEPSSPPSVADTVATASGDGYTLTVQSWNRLEQQALQLQEGLQNIYIQASSTFPAEMKDRTAYISTKLNEKYPGSKYDGMMGSVAIQNNTLAYFTGDLKVVRIENIDQNVGANYYIQRGRFDFNCGNNSVSALINTANPARSAFINARLPDIRADAEQILSSIGKPRIASGSAELAVVNDAYQMLALTEKISMETFASKVVSSKDWQLKVLLTAKKGYLERHPEEFGEKSSIKPVPYKELPAPSTSNSLSQFNFKRIIAIVVALVLVAGLSVLFVKGIRAAATLLSYYVDPNKRTMHNIRELSKSSRLRNIEGNQQDATQKDDKK